MSKLLGPDGRQITRKANVEHRTANLEMGLAYASQQVSVLTSALNFHIAVLSKAMKSLGVDLEQVATELQDEKKEDKTKKIIHLPETTKKEKE